MVFLEFERNKTNPAKGKNKRTEKKTNLPQFAMLIGTEPEVHETFIILHLECQQQKSALMHQMLSLLS